MVNLFIVHAAKRPHFVPRKLFKMPRSGTPIGIRAARVLRYLFTTKWNFPTSSKLIPQIKEISPSVLATNKQGLPPTLRAVVPGGSPPTHGFLRSEKLRCSKGAYQSSETHTTSCSHNLYIRQTIYTKSLLTDA